MLSLGKRLPSSVPREKRDSVFRRGADPRWVEFLGPVCSPLRHPFSPYFNRTDPENNAISKEINGLLDIVALEVGVHCLRSE